MNWGIRMRINQQCSQSTCKLPKSNRLDGKVSWRIGLKVIFDLNANATRPNWIWLMDQIMEIANFFPSRDIINSSEIYAPLFYFSIHGIHSCEPRVVAKMCCPFICLSRVLYVWPWLFSQLVGNGKKVTQKKRWINGQKLVPKATRQYQPLETC